jgi:hypothetical protein
VNSPKLKPNFDNVLSDKTTLAAGVSDASGIKSEPVARNCQQ